MMFLKNTSKNTANNETKIPFLNNLNRLNIKKNNAVTIKVIEPPIEEKPKKMKWGQPTWCLFHILAEKIKDEYFSATRAELLNNVYAICKNLPCPTCADHATKYMDNINFNAIQTKQQFMDLLYKFHNDVNIRKNVPILPYDQLSKYAGLKTIDVINVFIAHFLDKHFSIHMISNDMYRINLTKRLIEWFKKNLYKFDP